MKALVLEDDVIQTIFFKKKTINIDCNFEYVSSVDEAKYCIENYNYDICFVDLSLPNEDGYDFLKFIANYSSDMAIVFVSGASVDILRTSKIIAEELGLENFKSIKKPVEMHHIEGSVNWCSNLKLNSKIDNSHVLIRHEDILNIDLEDCLIPFYQPIICSESLIVTKVEVLSRLNHPDLGWISPDVFIPILIDLNFNFTETVISKSFVDYSCFLFIHPTLGISINLTHEDLINKKLIEFLIDKVYEFRLEPSKITIEVSEKNLGVNYYEILINICRLKIEGFVISMDDFGIGSSTLSNLINGVFDEIKLDKKFIQKSIYDDKFKIALKSMIKIAYELEVPVVCEGIENYSQLVESKRYGPVYLQGYYFSKPLDFLETKALLISDNKFSNVYTGYNFG